jgi:hypothetical protein
MICVELFCGTKSFTKIAKELGHEVYTIDILKELEPDLCIDINNLTIDMLPEKFKHPDIVWASPPCTTFSVASLRHYWINGKPKNKKTLDGIKLVKNTLEIIKSLNPKYFFIENPRGMLRKQDFMKGFYNNLFEDKLRRRTITYCKYGFEWQKATDIWTNCLCWKPRKPCKANSPCHIRAPRSSKNGLQGVKATQLKVRNGLHPDARYTISRDALERGKIPPSLFYEIFDCLKRGI